MKRNFRTEGIVLKNNRFGEIHKGVVFLSPEHGIMDAVAYGAYSAKGKLRSITNPLCSGTFFLYRDPVKDSVKITDLDCREFFEGVRGSLPKFFAASLWVETVLKTYGGDAEEVFSLLLSGLRFLDSCPEEAVPRLLVQVLLRYLDLSGTFPELDVCGLCGRRAEEGEAFLYRRGGHGLLCPRCASGAAFPEGDAAFSQGAVRYVAHTRPLDLRRAAAVELDPASFSGLKKALFALAEDLAGNPLNSLRTGAGIL